MALKTIENNYIKITGVFTDFENNTTYTNYKTYATEQDRINEKSRVEPLNNFLTWAYAFRERLIQELKSQVCTRLNKTEDELCEYGIVRCLELMDNEEKSMYEFLQKVHSDLDIIYRSQTEQVNEQLENIVIWKQNGFKEEWLTPIKVNGISQINLDCIVEANPISLYPKLKERLLNSEDC